MPDTIIITGPDDLSALGAGFVNPANAGFTKPAPNSKAPAAAAPDAVMLRDLSPNSVEVTVKGSAGGYLFLADAYAPGWRALSGGRELPVRPADVAFRTVALPADAKTVLFRYEPDSFRVGLFVALASCALVAAMAAHSLTARGRTG
jgi:hypothetical protein